jgi:hypothetical protein
MALVGTFATELKTCVMKLRRIGDTDGETIEIQHRATVPALGEVIEVSVGEAIVRARVTHISAPAANVPGEFTIGADELSSGYLWETLIDRPPLSGPGGMLVECWPLRQRERGRRSRLT